MIADGDLPMLPRVGLRLVLPGRFAHARFLGRGPHENYAERCTSALLGIYDLAVDDWARPYIYPAECGGRTGVRWLELRESPGEAGGLRIDAEADLQVQLARFTTEDLTAARHTIDLPRRDEVYVYVDYRHMGVGGDIGWGKSVREPYLIRPGVFRWAVRLSAL